MVSPPKIIVADDHPLFRAALCQAIRGSLGEETQILECEAISGLGEAITSNPEIDLILLDLQMPGANGFSGLLLVRREHPEIPVAIVSANEDGHTIQRAIEYGACGFIPKSSDLATIGSAIQAILRGDIWIPLQESPARERSREEREFSERIKTLTPQQLKVFLMLTRGLLNKQIAAEIDVSEATIRTHMTAIFRKLGVRNRTQAVLAANFLNLDEQTFNNH